MRYEVRFNKIVVKEALPILDLLGRISKFKEANEYEKPLLNEIKKSLYF